MSRHRKRSSRARAQERRAVPARQSAPRAPQQDAAPGADPAAAARAARMLWVVLAVMLVARVAFAFLPGTWVWALNVLRFIDPVTGWAGWTLAAAALIPAFSRGLEPLLSRTGDLLARGRVPVLLACAGAAALFVYALPDEVRFVGDFLLRQGTVEQAALPDVIWPQALPLDVWLHYTLPLALVEAGFSDANVGARLIGAVASAVLAMLAVLFVRALSLRGAAAAATAAVVYFGGYLGLFTGYSKAFTELVVIVAAVGVFGLQAARKGTGLLPLGVALALGFTLHRSALGLLPAAIFAWTVFLQREGVRSLRRPAVMGALAIPVLALAFMLPRIIRTVLQWDTVHFNPVEVQAQGGALQAALAGTRPADLVNLALMLSPLVLGVPVLLAAFARRLPRVRELVLLMLLAVPLVMFWPFIHPVHGMFRDWDDFAFTGASLSLITAWLVAETLRPVTHPGPSRAGTGTAARPAMGWLAVAVAAGAMVPSLQWVVLHTQLDRGLARVRAFVNEPPQRTPAERGHTWDFIGIRSFRLQRYEDAGNAWERAAETAPSPRVLQEWALAETQRANYRKAQLIYWRMLQKQPENVLGWLGLAATSSRYGDIHESRRAAREMLRLQPGNAQAQEILSYWNALPAAMRDSLERTYPTRDSTERERMLTEGGIPR